jgi:hypothetical protein
VSWRKAETFWPAQAAQKKAYLLTLRLIASGCCENRHTTMKDLNSMEKLYVKVGLTLFFASTVAMTTVCGIVLHEILVNHHSCWIATMQHG